MVGTEQTASANLNVSRRMVLLLNLLKRHDRADLARGANQPRRHQIKQPCHQPVNQPPAEPKPHGPYLSIIAKHARWTRVSNLPQIPSRACAGMEDLSRINSRLVVHYVGSCSTMTDRQHSAATSLRSSQPRRRKVEDWKLCNADATDRHMCGTGSDVKKRWVVITITL